MTLWIVSMTSTGCAPAPRLQEYPDRNRVAVAPAPQHEGRGERPVGAAARDAHVLDNQPRHAEQPHDEEVRGVEGERRPDLFAVLAAAEDFLEDGRCGDPPLARLIVEGAFHTDPLAGDAVPPAVHEGLVDSPEPRRALLSDGHS